MSELKFSKEYSVCKPKDEAVYPIPLSDWNRIKNRIKRICPQRRVYQVLASVCFGVFGSSILALVPFYNMRASLQPWVLPTAWAFLVVSLILGIALLIIDGQQKSIIDESTDSVIEDMDALEEKYKI